MPNINNLRAFLVSHQLKKGLKTFSIRGVEKKLNLPLKTLDHFIAGRRSLGDNFGKVETFFKDLGYKEELEYSQFI
jgi:hypothetical protein